MLDCSIQVRARYVSLYERWIVFHLSIHITTDSFFLPSFEVFAIRPFIHPLATPAIWKGRSAVQIAALLCFYGPILSASPLWTLGIQIAMNIIRHHIGMNWCFSALLKVRRAMPRSAVTFTPRKAAENAFLPSPFIFFLRLRHYYVVIDEKIWAGVAFTQRYEWSGV